MEMQEDTSLFGSKKGRSLWPPWWILILQKAYLLRINNLQLCHTHLTWSTCCSRGIGDCTPLAVYATKCNSIASN
jgi:hypothetical protein